MKKLYNKIKQLEEAIECMAVVHNLNTNHYKGLQQMVDELRDAVLNTERDFNMELLELDFNYTGDMWK